MKHKDIIDIVDKEWIKYDNKELFKVSKLFYKTNFLGKTVKNIDTGVLITFTMTGFVHTANARKKGYEKLVLFKSIDRILANATFRKFGLPSDIDKSKGIIGFMSFYAFVRINGIKSRVGIDVKFDNHGKFYYDHNIKITKGQQF